MSPGSVRKNLIPFLVPFLAIVTALVAGALIMLAFGDPPLRAYQGLLNGAFGNARGWSATIRNAMPLILTGLSVAVAFKAGLFNIGASGQYVMGSIASVAVGTNLEGMPTPMHLTLAILAGILAGALWGAIPGILKVLTGAHEVIVTIMLNYIASLFGGWIVFAGGTRGQGPGPLWDETAGAISRSPTVFESAQLPWIVYEGQLRISSGILIALFMALLMWWMIYKSTFGFEVRTVGLNAKAARYAGMSVKRITVLTMMIAGGLAGLAGVVITLGFNHRYAPEFTGAAGFDGIVVALLGQTHPLGVVLSALLVGAMNAGASPMQFASGVQAEIVQVIQALVLAFVAAPLIVRELYRIKSPESGGETKLSLEEGI